MRKHKTAWVIVYAIIVASHLAIGLGFGYFYRYFTVRGFEDVNEKVLDVTGMHVVDLPRGYPYILKLWGDDAPQDIFINDKKVDHSFFRQRPNIKEFYYFLPEALIDDARTRIRIEPAVRFSMRLRNSIASSEWGSIILPSSRTQPSTSPAPLVLFAGLAVALVFLWRLLCRFSPRLKGTDIAATYFWSCLLILFNFWLLMTIGRLFNVLFIFHPSSWTLCVLFACGLLYTLRGLARHLARLKRERARTAPGGSSISGVQGIDAVLNCFDLLGEAFKKTRSRSFAIAAVICLALTCLTLAFGLLLWANLVSIVVYACLLLATIRRLDEVRAP